MSVSLLSRRLGQKLMITKNLVPSSSSTACTSTIPSMIRLQSNESESQKQDRKTNKKTVAVNTQHEEWVKFQQSISVDGFETGQTTSVTTAALLGRKDRGGKSLRRRKQRELAEKISEQKQMIADLGGGEYPVLRLGEEETEKLLKEAFAAVPPRAGPRGVRRKKRNAIREELKRQYAKKKKEERIQTHFRRMEKRSTTIKAVLQMKADAIEIRQTEQEYQQSILQKYHELLQAKNNNTMNDDYENIAPSETEMQQPQTAV